MDKFIWRWPQRVFKRGQALAEYSIIVAIVAIASIAVVTVFGKSIRALLFASSEQLQGNADAKPGDYDIDKDEGMIQTDIDEW